MFALIKEHRVGKSIIVIRERKHAIENCVGTAGMIKYLSASAGYL